MSDNEGLPPGFVPALTFIRTPDGVVEYQHPAWEVIMNTPDPVIEENAATVQAITERIDWLHRAADAEHGRFTRCREAGYALAVAVSAFYEDRDEDKLRAAWSAYMALDSGNFHG
jgi:hypothetical protein